MKNRIELRQWNFSTKINSDGALLKTRAHNANLFRRLLKPRQDVAGVTVWREDGVKDFGDNAVVDNESHPLQQRFALDHQRWQLERVREAEVGV